MMPPDRPVVIRRPAVRVPSIPPLRPAPKARPRWLVPAVVGIVVLAGLGLGQLGGLFQFGGGSPEVLAPPAGLAPPPTGGLGVPWWKPKLLFTLGDPKISGVNQWTGDFDAAPIVAYDFDGDGTKELVGHSNDTHVYVFSGKTGRILADLTTTYPPAWHVERILNGVDVGKLRPNDPPSIVIGNHAATITVYQFVPSKSNAQQFTFTKSWEKRLTEYHNSPGMDANPVLADLNGDGNVDILAQTEESGLYALKHDGSTLWSLGWGGGNAAPLVADLYGDGKVQVVFGSDAGRLNVIDGRSGKAQWAFDARSLGIRPASIPVAPVAADLDGDGNKEVIFTIRDAHAARPAEYLQNHMAVVAVHRGANYQSELVWWTQPQWANPLSYTRPAVADVDGDGVPEVCGMDWNTVGHIPGNYERLGPAHVFCLDNQGNEKWMREVDAWWSNKAIAVADVDGDNKLEVLANGPRDGYDGLWRFDAATGRPEAFLASYPFKVQRGPVLVDLRGDGRTQLVLPVEPMEHAGRALGGLQVYELGVAWNAPWPGYD